MNFRLLSFGLLIAALANNVCHGDTEWVTEVEPDNQVFPSMKIALANLRPPRPTTQPSTHFGERAGYIGVVVLNPHDNTDIKLDIQCDDIMNETTFSCTLPTAGIKYEITPQIDYHFHVLAQVRQSIPTTIRFTISVDGKVIGTKTHHANLRSINDCPLYAQYADMPGKTEDQTFLLGAYVNEEHPLIDPLLKEALASGAIDDFTGYQRHDPKDVYRQVAAIWNALQRRHLKYSDITTEASESTKVSSQYIRLLEESLENDQANCVDGSVLFVSVLRKVGIRSYLALIPRHCFVAFNVDDKTIDGLETTMLGHTDLRSADKMIFITKAGKQKYVNGLSLRSFNAAIQAGSEELRENWPKFQTQSVENAKYRLIDIARVRELGISPIPYIP